MNYYYFMPAAYFARHYANALSSLVFYNDHQNGKDKIVKVTSKKYRDYLLGHVRVYKCPDLKPLTQEEAETQILQK